jgi:4-amino-4-deoxy-L-arabinose transferase-like glycosyltransferase
VWVGAIGHLLGVGLFVGSMVRWRAGWRLFHVSRLAERLRGLSWGLLLVVIGLALVLLGAYAALVPPVYARNYRLAILLWAAGVVTGVVGVIRPGHRGRRRRIRRGEWREAAWVGLLVLVGLALRMVALDRFPDVMSGDEGSFALEAGRIMQGVYLNPFGSAWFGNATWWFYLQAAAMQVMGWNLFALRFVSPFFGAFSVAAVYVLARATFGRETAWVSALFMAGWGFSVHMSRLGFSNCGDLLLPGLVMAFLQRGLTHGRRVHFVAAGLALGVAFYFYLGSRLTVPIMVATLFFAGKERLRMRWRGLLFLAVVALLVSGPLLAYFVRHPDAFLARHRVLDLILSGRLAAAQESTGKAGSLILLENLGPAATVFISTLDLGYFYRPASPMLYVLSGALFVLGLGLALFGWRQVRYKATLAWIVLTVLFAGMFLKPPPHYDRYEIVAPAVCLLVGRAGVVVVRRLARLAGWGRRARRVMVLALGVVLLAVNVAFYVGVYVPAGAFHWDRNTVIADRTARLMAGLGPDYETYFLGTRFMPLSGFNSVYVLAPEAEWEEFLDPPMEDWDLVNDERGMIFVVLPSRVDELAVLQERFPGGVTWEETARDDSVLFTVYRVDPTGN